ncbi:hypothetical protein [Thalassoglobus polymorphus]|uniref:Uncharacterized protein n=1 Tax=Thalassoglobus polymorphus TaxID=2527994 RepID=A0A517QP94_9PLAN|nr:hypothetical protein [Thalassoglobus polymorphus]QDT33446.1 hypothetical protein Mal48_26990 [Thalassoglobus polymorphus]
MIEDDFRNGLAMWDASQNLSRVWSIMFLEAKSIHLGYECTICDELSGGVSVG